LFSLYFIFIYFLSFIDLNTVAIDVAVEFVFCNIFDSDYLCRFQRFFVASVYVIFKDFL